MTVSNQEWFQRIARVVRNMLDECGGVCVMTREDIINTVKQEDPDLLWCPAQVLRHMTLAFRPSNGLSSVLFAEGDPETLFVYDPTKFATERHARRRFMEDRESFSCERHLAWLHARRPVRPAVV